MKLEDLQVICKLYQTQNLTQAAQQLYLSQPALTIRLQNLEHELGCQLAIRSNRGLLFTPLGEYLAKQAAAICALLDETLLGLNTLKNQDSGTIQLLAPASFSRYLLLDLLQEYYQHAPNVRLHIEVADSSQIVKEIYAQNAYCGFINGDYSGSLPKFKVADLQAYAVSRTPITLEQLPTFPFITHNTTSKTHALIQDWWFQQFKLPLNAQMNVKNIDICLNMVQAGLGVGIVFGDFWKKDHALYKLPLFCNDHTPLTRTSWFLYVPEILSSSCIHNFIDFLQSKFPLSSS